MTMGQEADNGGTMTVKDPALVPTFLDSVRRRLLLLFTAAPLSVSEASERSGQPLKRVHYHVIDFVRRGLLRIDREEKRKGRAIRYYRAVAPRFFVPIELLNHSPGAGLATELRRQLDDELFRSAEDGVLFHLEEGEPRVSWFGQSRASDKAGEFWQIVSLSPEQVRAFSAELRALMLKYDALSSAGGSARPYLLHAAFAPRREER